jgi:hypothetical protein
MTASEWRSTAEQILNTNILTYIGQLVAEGRYTALTGLGAREDQIPRLSRLSFQEFALIGASPLSAALIQARIDPDVLDIVFRNLERLHRERESVRRLMLAGASQRLMEELTGMDASQYAQLRLALGLRGADNGRPKELLRIKATAQDKAEADRMWQVWQDSEPLDDLERWLRVHDITGQSLRTIERVIRASRIHASPWQAPSPAGAAGTKKKASPHGR